MARQGEVLPVEYYHVVFTLPAQLAPVALQNKRVVYDILFRAASQTLLRIGARRAFRPGAGMCVALYEKLVNKENMR